MNRENTTDSSIYHLFALDEGKSNGILVRRENEKRYEGREREREKRD